MLLSLRVLSVSCLPDKSCYFTLPWYTLTNFLSFSTRTNKHVSLYCLAIFHLLFSLFSIASANFRYFAVMSKPLPSHNHTKPYLILFRPGSGLKPPDVITFAWTEIHEFLWRHCPVRFPAGKWTVSVDTSASGLFFVWITFQGNTGFIWTYWRLALLSPDVRLSMRIVEMRFRSLWVVDFSPWRMQNRKPYWIYMFIMR